MIAVTGTTVGKVRTPWGAGPFRLISNKEKFTNVKTMKIKKLVNCARVNISKKSVNVKTNSAVTTVATIGVWVLGCTVPRNAGSHPCLLIP